MLKGDLTVPKSLRPRPCQSPTVPPQVRSPSGTVPLAEVSLATFRFWYNRVLKSLHYQSHLDPTAIQIDLSDLNLNRLVWLVTFAIQRDF